jgi:hypothetical protein
MRRKRFVSDWGREMVGLIMARVVIIRSNAVAREVPGLFSECGVRSIAAGVGVR